MSPFFRTLLALALCMPALCSGASNEICVYQDREGKLHQVRSASDIPDDFRGMSKCYASGQNEYLAKPEDISLKGNIREQTISSSIGRISLRWPRSVEALFGRTPERAMADAATTVSRVLKSSGFTPELQRLDLDWQVVFMDENVPGAQIPYALVSNCHPAWMTPPTNLYVAAQRVVAGCGAGASPNAASVNDAQLSQVLIHEIAHAVEYALLNGKGGRDRIRAEGFACWFEQYGSDYSSVSVKGAARKQFGDYARQAFAASPQAFSFQGTALDYARASMFFHALVNKRGISGLMSVYKTIVDEDKDFMSAVNSRYGWSPSEFNTEAMKALP